jgi:hypothetical protein
MFSSPNLRAFHGLGVPGVSTILGVSFPFCLPAFHITFSVVMVMDPVASNFSTISMVRNGLDFVIAFCFSDLGFKSFGLLSFLLHLVGSFASSVTMIRVPEATSFQTVQVRRRVIVIGKQSAGVVHRPSNIRSVASHLADFLTLVADDQPFFIKDTFGMVIWSEECLFSINTNAAWALDRVVSGGVPFLLVDVRELLSFCHGM